MNRGTFAGATPITTSPAHPAHRRVPSRWMVPYRVNPTRGSFGGHTPNPNFAEWQPYYPQLLATTTNPSIGTDGLIDGRYCRQGSTVWATVDIRFGSTGMSVGSGNYRITLPFMPRLPVVGENEIGHGELSDASVAIQTRRNPLIVYQIAGTQQAEMVEAYGKNILTNALPQIPAVGDEIHLFLMYELP